MGALATHILIGMFVAAVAGVSTRYLPVAGLVAEIIDLDHMFSGPGPHFERAAEPVWMMNRATFHNVWIVAVIPAAVAIWVYWQRRGSADVRRLVAAAPAFLSAHTLFDMVDLHSGEPFNGSFPFYPFSMQRLAFDVTSWTPRPEYFDAFSFAMLTALGLGLAARILTTSIRDEAEASAFQPAAASQQSPPDAGEAEQAAADPGGGPGDAKAGPAPTHEVQAPEVEAGRDRDERVIRAIVYGTIFVFLVPLSTWLGASPAV